MRLNLTGANPGTGGDRFEGSMASGRLMGSGGCPDWGGGDRSPMRDAP
ncbi:MAG: hypothetical protein ACRC8Y_23350 [Chroococcales cyanobacterium]